MKIIHILLPLYLYSTLTHAAETPGPETTKPVTQTENFTEYFHGSVRIYGSEKTVDFQIDQSGNKVGVAEIVVNSPDKPVLLELYAYDPTIWNISWTPGTKIIAVVASGYHRQAISGISKDLPHFSDYYENSLSEKNKNELSKIKTKLAKIKNEIKVNEFKSLKNIVVVGKPLKPGTEVKTSEDIPIDSFHDKNAPLAGEAGLNAAVNSGVLRKGTAADINLWSDELEKIKPLDLPPIDGASAEDLKSKIPAYNLYVIEKVFTFPSGLHGAHSATFILKKGVPKPLGDMGHSGLYDMNTMTTLGVHEENRISDEELKINSTGAKKLSRKISSLNIVGDYNVYAAAAGGKEIDYSIDDSNKIAHQQNVIINEPKKPVVLMLISQRPMIWSINLTKKTKVLAIFTSGAYAQKIAGVGSDIPVFTSSMTDRLNPFEFGCLGGASEGGIWTQINPFSRVAFGRPVSKLYILNKNELIGDKLLPNEELLSDKINTPESHFDRTRPMTGKAGLDEAVKNGQIRKMDLKTDADLMKLAKAKARNSEERLNEPYIVQKPFIYPAGLYGGHSVVFIIPKGVPIPTGERGHCTVYDLNQ